LVYYDNLHTLDRSLHYLAKDQLLQMHRTYIKICCIVLFLEYILLTQTTPTVPTYLSGNCAFCRSTTHEKDIPSSKLFKPALCFVVNYFVAYINRHIHHVTASRCSYLHAALQRCNRVGSSGPLVIRI